MKKLVSVLLAITGVTVVTFVAVAEEIEYNRGTNLVQQPTEIPQNAEAVPLNPNNGPVKGGSKYLMGIEASNENNNLERGINDFNWNLPNSNNQSIYYREEDLTVRLTDPESESGDGFEVNVDLNRLGETEKAK